MPSVEDPIGGAVRLAGPDDAPLLARMLHDFNTEFEMYSPGADALEPRLRELVSGGSVVALLGGDDEGLAILRFRPSIWSDGEIAYLEELYVVPARRRRGIGERIMRRVIELVRERGCGSIELGTSTDDVGAIALYEKLGFCGEEGGPGGPRMLFYELEL